MQADARASKCGAQRQVVALLLLQAAQREIAPAKVGDLVHHHRFQLVRPRQLATGEDQYRVAGMAAQERR